MRYELKPLGVGETFDQAIQILKDRLGLFLLISLVLRVPETAFLQYLVLTNIREMPLQPTDVQMSEFLQRLGHLYLYVLGPSFLIEFFVINPITNGALVHAAARIYLGENVSVWESLRMAFRRYFALVWTSLLFWVLVFVGTACCILPGILLGFRFALATTVAVLEPVSGFAALARSRDLMRSEGHTNYINLFLILMVIFFFQWFVGGSASLIPQLHLQVLASAVLGASMYAFTCAVWVVFYYSCRCRNEGFDLLYLTKIVAETPIAEPALQAQG